MVYLEYVLEKVSICVVTHNNQEEILKLIHSIYTFTRNLNFKVFVVDNASSDETVKCILKDFPEISLLNNKRNLGFGKAHNLVLNKIDSKYHLILNPDITIRTNIVKELVDYLESDPATVIVTPKIIFPDGKPQFLPKKNPSLKYVVAGRLERLGKFFSTIRREYTMCEKERVSALPFNIEFCTGCFMMIRTEVFKKLRGFDERFFMYLEDADLSRRAKKYGQIIFLPTSTAIHAWHRGSSKHLKLFLVHLCSLMKYLLKWKNEG